MNGGLMPRLAPTGREPHDLALRGGRLGVNIGVAWLLMHVWFVYAGATFWGLLGLAQKLGIDIHHPAHIYIYVGLAIWLMLQFLYLWFWGRVFDGKRVKRDRSRRHPLSRRRFRPRWVTTEVVDGHVVFVDTDPPVPGQVTFHPYNPSPPPVIQSPVRPHIPAAMRRFILARDGYRCQECGSTEDLEIDHIIAWTKGGATTPENLEVLCRPCNASKGNRP